MRFENLADDFRAVCTAIGISPPTSKKLKPRSIIRSNDDELRELVRSRFAAERFGGLVTRIEKR